MQLHGVAPPRSRPGRARVLLLPRTGSPRSAGRNRTCEKAWRPCSRCCTPSTVRAWESTLNRRRSRSRRVRALLTAHTDALLGPPPRERTVRIMVTMPGEAGADYALVRDLLAAGMDCMRINCAHDGAATWERMIHHLGKAKRELKRDCQHRMDIAGPETANRSDRAGAGGAEDQAAPRRLRSRHETGVVALVPASQVTGRRASRSTPFCPSMAICPSALNSGDAIEFDDARGRSRRLIVRARDGDGSSPSSIGRPTWRPEHSCDSTASADSCDAARRGRPTAPADPGPQEGRYVAAHARLVARGGWRSSTTTTAWLQPARIGVTLPEVFRDVQPGEAIWFDDGKIGGLVRAVDPEQIIVEITRRD